MPTEDTPVRVRDSVDARDFWARQSSVTHSLRVPVQRLSTPSPTSLQGPTLLPFQVQERPIFTPATSTYSWPSSKNTNPVRKMPLQSSRSVERLVLTKALAEAENDHATYKLKTERAQKSLLKVNKALACAMLNN